MHLLPGAWGFACPHGINMSPVSAINIRHSFPYLHITSLIVASFLYRHAGTSHFRAPVADNIADLAMPMRFVVLAIANFDPR